MNPGSPRVSRLLQSLPPPPFPPKGVAPAATQQCGQRGVACRVHASGSHAQRRGAAGAGKGAVRSARLDDCLHLPCPRAPRLASPPRCRHRHRCPSLTCRDGVGDQVFHLLPRLVPVQLRTPRCQHIQHGNRNRLVRAQQCRAAREASASQSAALHAATLVRPTPPLGPRLLRSPANRGTAAAWTAARWRSCELRTPSGAAPT